MAGTNDPPVIKHSRREVSVQTEALQQSDDNLASVLIKEEITLTDAQIKALPTTGVELIAAPGANKIAWVIAAYLRFESHGAYSNFDMSVHLDVGCPSPADPMADVTIGDLLLGSSVNKNSPMAMATGMGTVDADIVNKAVQLYATNGSSGNFTGGNAANKLKVFLRYIVLDFAA